MGAAKIPIDFIVRPEWDGTDELFLDDNKMRRFQMPLESENFKRDNMLVLQILKLACIKSDAWTWVRSFDRTANGRKAWLALVAHYDGTGEVNNVSKKLKRRSLACITRTKRYSHLRNLSPSSRKTFICCQNIRTKS